MEQCSKKQVSGKLMHATVGVEVNGRKAEP